MKYLILFFLYSFVGISVEVFFTSIHDYIKTRDIAFRGRSYLWMFPIYGSHICRGIYIWLFIEADT